MYIDEGTNKPFKIKKNQNQNQNQIRKGLFWNQLFKSFSVCFINFVKCSIREQSEKFALHLSDIALPEIDFQLKK
jgi:hypothetical protein